MSYRIITATLRTRTALHIGSGQDSDLTDALIRRDADGRPFIPGTAIAGALRSLATRLAPRLATQLDSKPCAALTGSSGPCSCIVCHLFGDINPSDEEEAESTVSRILVFNARPKGAIPRLFIRDGVGIDRVTGAAARAGSVKFDLEVLPAGAEFEVRLELQDADETDEQLLAALLAEWQAGRAWLGGCVARGLGAFTLEDIEYKILDLNDADNLLAFLKTDEPWNLAVSQKSWLQDRLSSIQVKSIDDRRPSVIQCWVMTEGILQAEGPLLTNDTTIAGTSGFDHAPLLLQVGDWQHPVLTGAGLRGVLRAHAERIARTLATYNANGLDEFLHKCPACSSVESRSDAPLTSCDSLLKDKKISTSEEATEEHLCLACRLFGSRRQGSRLIVEDAPFDREVAGNPKLKMLDFLAIDRFTGGGKEGAKFDALALWKPAFRMRLHLENPEPWELGWLALVLRDLEEGWLSVGFGTAKGFGRVRLQNWTVTFGYLTEDDLPFEPAAFQSRGVSGLFKIVTIPGGTEKWNKVANPWVQAFRQEVKSFNRTAMKLSSLKVDSYFGKVDTFYPVKGEV